MLLGKKKLIPISMPLNDIYSAKDEQINDDLYVIIRKADQTKLAEFHVDDIPNIDKNITEMSFINSARNHRDKVTIFYVQ